MPVAAAPCLMKAVETCHCPYNTASEALSRPAAAPDQQMQAGLQRPLETSRHPRSCRHPAWRVGIGGGRASLHRDAPSKPLAQGQPILGQPCSREPRTSAEPSSIHQAEGMLVLDGRLQNMFICKLQAADRRFRKIRESMAVY
jgi:hypothetical protein